MECDICQKTEGSTFLSNAVMRKAVYENHFDPYQSGLIPATESLLFESGQHYADWKNSLGEHDAIGWHICPSCMSILNAYLNKNRKPNSGFAYAAEQYQSFRLSFDKRYSRMNVFLFILFSVLISLVSSLFIMK